MLVCKQIVAEPGQVYRAVFPIFVGNQDDVEWTCVCVCIGDAFQGCVWDAAQVSAGVCWATSLQGTGYQAEREAIMLITLHTPCQPSVQRNCWAHTHSLSHSHTHAARKHTHVPAPLGMRIHTHRHAHTHTHTRLSFILLFFCFPTPIVWRPWTSIPLCFQERLFYILINSTLSCEINWHSFNDFKFLRGCSFVSGCQWAASQIGLNVLSSHTPG